MEKLESASSANRSLLCVGLDPDPRHMPVSDVFEFNRAIIDATLDLVCSYKPNVSFYEAQGIPGLEALKRTVEYIHNATGGVPVIGDAKRGDLGTLLRELRQSHVRCLGIRCHNHQRLGRA